MKTIKTCIFIAIILIGLALTAYGIIVKDNLAATAGYILAFVFPTGILIYVFGKPMKR